MAGFSSQADIQAAIAAGKCNEVQFRKTGVDGNAASAYFCEYFTATGTPGAIAFSGTAGVAVACDNTTSGALTTLPEGNVSTARRYLLGAQCFTTASTVAPGIVLLVDLLLYYPSVVVTGTPTTLDNTVTLPRYTSGEGVMAVGWHAALGGGCIMSLSYTANDNSGQTAGILRVTNNAGRFFTLDPTSVGTSGGASFLPLTGATSGVKKIDSYTISTGTTGTATFALVKPLAIIPIVAQSAATERDCVQPFVSLPRIYDGACLALMVLPSASFTPSGCTISGSIKYGWN